MGESAGAGAWRAVTVKVVAGAIDRVGIASALGARQTHGTGRQEFVEGGAAAVDSDTVALGFSDLQEVHAHAGEADGLGGGRALGHGRQALEVQHVDAEEKCGGYQESNERLHKEIVRRSRERCNNGARPRAEGNNRPVRPPRRGALCYTRHAANPSFPVIASPPPGQSQSMSFDVVDSDVEKLREEELEEARAIQSVMLPTEPLRAGAVRISHHFGRWPQWAAIFWIILRCRMDASGCTLVTCRGKGLRPPCTPR